MLLRKLSLVLVPLVLGVVSAALPGRAQQNPFDPTAFADTSLLRDTLGLTFPRLFELADSLEVPPDTLRALSIRHRLPLPRLVVLADSLQMPVDSVGPHLLRERFNPLASRTARSTAFVYNTSYNLQQTRSGWVNGSDYNLARGPLFVHNVTTIQIDRFETGDRTTEQLRRDATTELGWRFNPDVSFGGRAVLSRFDSDDPSTVTQIGETQDEFQLSVRTKQQPFRGLSSEFNLFSGVLDLRNSLQEKRGFTTDMSGNLRHVSGNWFAHDVRGSMVGNFGRTRVVATQTRESTRDLLGDMRGEMNLFRARRVGFNGTYSLKRTRVRRPEANGELGEHRTSSANLAATLRTQLPSGGFINLSERLDASDQVTVAGGPLARRSSALSADGRYALAGFGLEGRFALDDARTEVPQASPTGGYAEDLTSRALEGTVTRRFFQRLTTRLNARIGLTSYRYRVIGNYGTPPINRDQARQSYRVDGTYAFSQDFNSGIELEVSRTQLVNLPSASTAANHTLRSYRAEWRWTYRLLRGLTATQRNVLVANYTAYQFLGGSDRLLLDYATTTTLNAVLTSRLSVDLTHSGQVQPSGNYLRQADGLYAFLPADETRNFSLSSRMQYTPFSGVSLTFEPSYRANERDGSVGGVTVPQRESRNLNFLGSANLNLPVGRSGTLSGSLGRTYFADRTTTFAAGVPQPSPRSGIDFWNASLQFSWSLQ